MLDESGDFTREAKLCVGKPQAGSAIIHGDNHAVLESLGDAIKGRVKCVYIDPPYNNAEVYRHYDDRLGRRVWLDRMELRLKALKETLTVDGSLWVSIDDSELHNLRWIGDKVFGSENFISSVVWNHRKTRENRRPFSTNHEYILCFARNAEAFKRSRNLLAAPPEILNRYKNPDNDPRGAWQSVSANVQDGHATKSQFYTLVAPNGRRHRPPKGRCWVYNQPKMEAEIRASRVYFGRDGNAVPRLKKYLSEAKIGIAPSTLWMADEVGTTDSAKKHLMALLTKEAVFDTPKPEGLVHRILHIASNPGDLILDAYLGSGTTAAVAMKTGRKFLGIEQGPHIATHCVKRLQMVHEGEAGGISPLVGWKGGGGCVFYSHRSKLTRV
ncbi:MAG: site-specific DNA-methyltransferase [Alphaproteobacteria bacterium HGW-Alphaproteobacteria-11]|nr:MAG: site-specific DNA-methyltransferase [Alphaproteobacteria bacterium HGW-Alphaproteobacteria-11]